MDLLFRPELCRQLRGLCLFRPELGSFSLFPLEPSCQFGSFRLFHFKLCPQLRGFCLFRLELGG